MTSPSTPEQLEAMAKTVADELREKCSAVIVAVCNGEGAYYVSVQGGLIQLAGMAAIVLPTVDKLFREGKLK